MSESSGWSSPDAAPGPATPGPGHPPPPPAPPGRQDWGSGVPAQGYPQGHHPPPAPAPPGWAAQPPPGPPGPPGWAPAQPPPAQAPPQAWNSAPTGAPQVWSGWVAQRPPEVKPGVVPLRPLGVGEILDGAIATMRRHWKIQLGLSAAVVTVTSVLQFGVLWVLFDQGVATVGDTGLSGDPASDISGAANAASVIAGLVGMLAQFVLTGFLSIVVSRAVLGQDVSMGEAWAAARGRRWRLVGMSACILLLMIGLIALPIGLGAAVAAASTGTAGIAVGVVTGIGCIVLAVWLYVSIGVAAPAMMLEQSGVRTALSRSRRLVRGNWWRVFGILLLGYVIAQVLSSIIAVPFVFASVFTSDLDAAAPGFSFYLLNVVGSSLGGTISYPFAAGVIALVYVDLRMRREGLDMALARAAGAGHPQPAPGPVPQTWYGTRP